MTWSLFENAFVLLGIPPSSSNTEIVEAFEDAVGETTDQEKVLTEAKQNLLDPKFRINSELSCLIDTSSEKATAAIAALRRAPLPTDLTRILGTLGPLSRLNFLMHVAVNVRCDKDILLSLIHARARIRYDGLFATLNATRGASGLRGPTLETVRAAFDKLLNNQIRAVFVC